MGEQGQCTLLQSLFVNGQVQLHRVHIPVAKKLLDQFKGHLTLEQPRPKRPAKRMKGAALRRNSR